MTGEHKSLADLYAERERMEAEIARIEKVVTEQEPVVRDFIRGYPERLKEIWAEEMGGELSLEAPSFDAIESEWDGKRADFFRYVCGRARLGIRHIPKVVEAAEMCYRREGKPFPALWTERVLTAWLMNVGKNRILVEGLKIGCKGGDRDGLNTVVQCGLARPEQDEMTKAVKDVLRRNGAIDRARSMLVPDVAATIDADHPDWKKAYAYNNWRVMASHVLYPRRKGRNSVTPRRDGSLVVQGICTDRTGDGVIAWLEDGEG